MTRGSSRGLELSHLRELILRELAVADLAGQPARFAIRDVLEYKVLKANLRAAGITAATFDRDATGSPELGVSLKNLKRRST